MSFHATPRWGLQVGVSVGSTLAGRFLGLHGPDDAAFQRRKTVNLAHGLDVVETSPFYSLTPILANKRRKLVRTPVNNN